MPISSCSDPDGSRTAAISRSITSLKADRLTMATIFSCEAYLNSPSVPTTIVPARRTKKGNG
jgi:hypothetical protein